MSRARSGGRSGGGDSGDAPTPGLSGVTRIILWGVGESGMAGAAPDTGAYPTGHPTRNGKVANWSSSRLLSLPNELINDQGPSIVDTTWPTTNGGVSWLNCFASKLAASLSDRYQVVIVNCGFSATNSTDWVQGGALSLAAIARVQSALALPGSVLGGIFLDQGINDPTPAGWGTRWSAIIDSYRTALGNYVAPVIYRKIWTQPMDRLALRAEQQAWESSVTPKRICVDSPNGPYDLSQAHLADTAAYVFAQSVMDQAGAAVRRSPRATEGLKLEPEIADITAIAGVVEVWDPTNRSITSWVGQKAGLAVTFPNSAALVADGTNGRPAIGFTEASNHYGSIPAAAISGASNTGGFGFFAAQQPVKPINGFHTGIVSIAAAAGGGLLFDALNTGALQLYRNGPGQTPQGTAATGSAAGSSAGTVLMNGESCVVGFTWTSTQKTRFWKSGTYADKISDTADNTIDIGTINFGALSGFSVGGAPIIYNSMKLGAFVITDGTTTPEQNALIGRYLRARCP